MPRINIEDSELASPEFHKFSIAVGNYAEAVGAFALALRVAQEFYKYGKKSVPFSRFKRLDHGQKLIDFGLFYRGREGVTYRDSEREFAWIWQKVESSRKGVESRRKIATERLPGANPPTPTPTPTHINTHVATELKSSASNFVAQYEEIPKHQSGIRELIAYWNSKPELKSLSEAKWPQYPDKWIRAIKYEPNLEYWKACIDVLATDDWWKATGKQTLNGLLTNGKSDIIYAKRKTPHPKGIILR